MSGVHNPWGKPPTKQQEANAKIDAILANDPTRKPPRRSSIFEGRSFQIVVDFYSFELDPAQLTRYAADALGRAITAAREKARAVESNLSRQSVVFEEDKALWPKVSLKLGPTTLFARASSHDPKLAYMMAIDRVSLALMDAMLEAPALRAFFTNAGIIITRKA